jgi:type IV pilus assembly protein PilE
LVSWARPALPEEASINARRPMPGARACRVPLSPLDPVPCLRGSATSGAPSATGGDSSVRTLLPLTNNPTMASNNTSAARARTSRGFTLIELMIVVTLVAILSAIALPAYQSQVRKSRRSDAVAAIAAVQAAQERFRANNTAYTTNLTTALPAGLGLSATSPAGRYTISVTVATGTNYTVQAVATAAGGQTADTGCTTLTTTVTAGSAVNTPAACWSQ